MLLRLTQEQVNIFQEYNPKRKTTFDYEAVAQMI